MIALPTLNTSSGAHLALAQLSHKAKASEAAMDNYQRALIDDPWLWEAFTGLCDLGKLLGRVASRKKQAH